MKNCFDRIRLNTQFDSPAQWMKINCIDMHTGGEPLRVVLDGLPEIFGANILEKRAYFRSRHDGIRKSLMWEPRGHADMYGCIITEPNDENAHFGVIFIHNEGYSTMCGHAVIALCKLAINMKWVEIGEDETEVIIDAPCGRIYTYGKKEDGKATTTRFQCVPSFVVAVDQVVEIPGFGEVQYDIAYGGAFYAYVDADKIQLDLDIKNYSKIIKAGMDIKHTVAHESSLIQHPFETDFSFLYGTIFTSKKSSAHADSRNVCVFANGEVDRSPTGSGVAGRMALHYRKGEIALGQEMKVESIVGSIFSGSVIREEEYGSFSSVVPQVEGEAFFTGQHVFYIDPNDPFRQGFFLR